MTFAKPSEPAHSDDGCSGRRPRRRIAGAGYDVTIVTRNLAISSAVLQWPPPRNACRYAAPCPPRPVLTSCP